MSFGLYIGNLRRLSSLNVKHYGHMCGKGSASLDFLRITFIYKWSEDTNKVHIAKASRTVVSHTYSESQHKPVRHTGRLSCAASKMLRYIVEPAGIIAWSCSYESTVCCENSIFANDIGKPSCAAL